MYAIENIIRNSFKKDNEKLSILVINDNNNDYVERLAENLDHTFYVIQYNSNWNKGKKENIIFCKDVDQLGTRYIDLIITFNRLGGYEYAEKISLNFHIPIITIDTVTSEIKVPIPFFTTANITNIEKIALRNGDVSVGITDRISKSWNNPYQNIGMYISTVTKKINTIENSNKILIDDCLDKKYIESIDLNLNENFTGKPQEACLYLHLWQNITPLMLDCMASNIPVITFESKDFIDLIQNKCCVVIQDIKQVNSKDFIQQILNFQHINTIKNNALIYSKNNLNTNFKKEWDNILYHVSNKCFMRGM